MRNAIWVVLGLCVLTAADDPGPQSAVEVYDWSIWVGDPSQTSLNGVRTYRNAMPGAVGTIRPAREARRPEKGAVRPFDVEPVSVAQVFGAAATDVDFDLRVKKGTLLAHWPPGSDRGGRVQWFKSDLVVEPPADRPVSYLPDDHWFQSLRSTSPALYLKSKAISERFLAYDAEVATPIPLKLRGGPDEYTLQNLTSYNLLDVAVVAPTEDGYRVGWLDELPAAVPESAEKDKDKDKDKEKKEKKEIDPAKAEEVFAEADKEAEEAKPLPPEGDASVKARVDQALNRPVTMTGGAAPRKDLLGSIAGQARLRFEVDEPTLLEAKTDLTSSIETVAGQVAARDALADVLATVGLSYRVTDAGALFITTAARLAEAAGKVGVVLEGPPVKLTLSQPLKADNPSYRELTRDSLARRLAVQGLREEASRTILDRYSPTLFEPNELIVLAHLSREAINEVVELDVFPPPKTFVRTAVVVAHGIDPRLQDQARELVKNLGDPSPKARETAESQLLALGPVAVPALEDALREKDVEIVFRAERLLMMLNRQVP